MEAPLELEAIKGQLIDVIAVMLYPVSHGSFHLQKLAPLTRELSDKDTCKALRGAENKDAMRAVFVSADHKTSQAA